MCSSAFGEYYDGFSSKIDMFAAGVPQFTLQGKGAIPSNCGVLISCLIYFMAITSWLPTILGNLFLKENPGLVDITSDGVYGEGEPIELYGMKAPEMPGGKDLEEAKKRRVFMAFRVVNFND